MTNQNPASSQPPSSNINRDILAKVNAHADRSIERIFADIDELLSGDLETETQYSAEHYPTRQKTQAYLPQHSDIASPLDNPSQPVTPKQAKKTIPIWLKALLGIGITSIAASSVLLWLVNERKIELPKNIDTSWLPFQSSQVSPEDAKFAEYMRKSISKIDSANTPSTSATNLPNPSNNIATSIASNPTGIIADPIAPNPTGIIATVPSKITPTVIKTPISLVKTLSTNNRPGAIFQIDGRSQTVNVGQKIGTSNWSLLTVAKGEVIVKRKGGEIRSIDVGQKF
jgi:hypothetical protein